jgi:tRNA-Thr(GGU) m(6)t(6)A37 methyltransferase TsaA
MKPIGYFKCQLRQKVDSPRQGTLTSDTEIGIIQLISKNNFEQAVAELETFSHIWIIYQFHLNKTWKPMVLPPRSDKKVGVFASRSPYRPNPIGICAAELVKIKGLHIYVKKFDLLDGTPILDIKPYLKYSDSFTEASEGWLFKTNQFEISLSKNLEEKMNSQKNNEPDLFHQYDKLTKITIQQLSFDPLNKSKKRVKKIRNNYYEFSYRYSRVYFRFLDKQNIEIETIVI